MNGRFSSLRHRFSQAERLGGRVWAPVRLFKQVAREQGLRVAVGLSLGVMRRGITRYIWWSGLRPFWRFGRAYRPPEVRRPPLRPHQASVDVVICVHDALEDVRQCLEALVRYTRMPYRLIVVDDGSGSETRDYLAKFAFAQGAVLIHNEAARGYTLAANQGLRRSDADYVVLLNSDTVVSTDWLDRLIACAEADPRIGLVGPISNTASWQSVPVLFDAQGDWANNDLPPGIAIPDMAAALAGYAGRTYPRLPFLNGFCLMVRRPVINRLGYFDEERFGQGYGEENDYCLRARAAGWQLAVADDVYVYHRQSRSYSHERRRLLSERAHEVLVAKHGQQPVGQGLQACRQSWELAGVRARVGVMQERRRLTEAGRARWEGRRVGVILPIGELSGGANVIIQEARAMRAMGVDVQVVNLASNRLFPGADYVERRLPVRYVDGPAETAAALEDCDAAVATLYVSVDWLEPLSRGPRRPVLGYYVQDFEPYFFAPGSSDEQIARRSYTRYPDLVRLTKTEWNAQTVRVETGAECTIIGPSVDLDLYRPRPRPARWPQVPLRIAAMIRPNTPRRQPGLTMEVLRQVQRAHGGAVDVVLFGCAPDDPGFVRLARDFGWRSAGRLRPEQLAGLLSEADVFVDCSSFQALGLTALEAMASGTAVIVPQNSGAKSFARHGDNALVVDTTSPEACAQALEQLVTDDVLRDRLARQALQDAVQFFPERAAYAALAALFPKDGGPC